MSLRAMEVTARAIAVGRSRNFKHTRRATSRKRLMIDLERNRCMAVATGSGGPEEGKLDQGGGGDALLHFCIQLDAGKIQQDF